MGVFNISDFKASLDTGLLPQNKYMFLVNSPLSLLTNVGPFVGQIGTDEAMANQYAASRIRFMSPMVTLPGAAIQTHQVRRFGYGPFENKPFVTTFTDINIELLIDGDGHMFRFLHRWRQLINNTDFIRNTSVGPGGLHFFEVAFKNQYAVDAEIWVFKKSDDETPSVKVALFQCFPIFISDTPLAWDHKNDVFRLMTTWTFFTWAPLDIQGVFQGSNDPTLSSLIT